MGQKSNKINFYLLCFLITCVLLLSNAQTVSTKKVVDADSNIILVTGFEPWASHQCNPSALVAQQLNGSVFNDQMVYGMVLPVDFDVALKKVNRLIKEKQPSLIICLGLAPGTSVIKVESIGFNMFYDPYIDNFFQAVKRVNLTGPPFLLSSIQISESVEALKESNVTSEQSYFAGLYLCNAILYESLNIVHHQNMNIQVGFIHLPQINNDNEQSWQLSDLVEAITLVIQINS